MYYNMNSQFSSRLSENYTAPHLFGCVFVAFCKYAVYLRASNMKTKNQSKWKNGNEIGYTRIVYSG